MRIQSVNAAVIIIAVGAFMLGLTLGVREHRQGKSVPNLSREVVVQHVPDNLRTDFDSLLAVHARIDSLQTFLYESAPWSGGGLGATVLDKADRELHQARQDSASITTTLKTKIESAWPADYRCTRIFLVR